MKKQLLSGLIILLFIGEICAQRGRRGLVDNSGMSYNYLTLNLGPAYCFADTKAYPLTQSILSNWDLSLGYRKSYSNNLGFKIAMDYSNFTGTDEGTISKRGYSFTSNVLQISGQAEYSILIGKLSPNSIYAFIGAGILKSNAKLTYDITKVDISKARYLYQPVTIAPVIPFGAGYQYDFDNGFLIGAEMTWRLPISDTIDGFSPPSSNSKSNDVIIGFSLTMSYLLDSENLNRRMSRSLRR